MGALRQALQLDPTRMKAAVLLAQLLDRAERSRGSAGGIERGLPRRSRGAPRLTWHWAVLRRKTGIPKKLSRPIARRLKPRTRWKPSCSWRDSWSARRAWKRRRRYWPTWTSHGLNRRRFWEISSCWPESRCWPATTTPGICGMALGRLRAGSRSRGGNTARELISRLIEADIQAFQRSDPSQVPLLMKSAREHLAKFGGELDQATRCILSAELELIDGDLTVAAEEARKAVEIAPESASAHYVLGLLHQRMGDESGAVTEWQTALENRSDFAPANLVLAETMLRAGKIGRAERYVIPVLRQEPASLRALVIFCRVLKAQGNLSGGERGCRASGRHSTRPRRRPAFCAGKSRWHSIR